MRTLGSLCRMMDDFSSGGRWGTGVDIELDEEMEDVCELEERGEERTRELVKERIGHLLEVCSVPYFFKGGNETDVGVGVGSLDRSTSSCCTCA